MANYTQDSNASDDEEDLESLRLAALQSLKQKALCNNSDAMTVAPLVQLPFNNNMRPNNNNRSYRGYRGGGGGRPPRGNMQHQRSRTNTNLISIQTVPDPEVAGSQVIKNKEIPKLVLPQDRYCSSKNEIKNEEVNKFNRYDNSEESDSESDAENNSNVSEPGSPGELKKADSLEQLMDELENEMVGEKDETEVKLEAPKAKMKTKKVKKNKQTPIDTIPLEIENKQDISNSNALQNVKIIEENVSHTSPALEEKIQVKPKTLIVEPPKSSPSPKSSPINRRRSRSPLARNRSRSPMHSSPVYRTRSPMPRSPRRVTRYTPPPQHYERPLSPLNLNADVLNTIAMAPLSPRSAAFVLKNREILARRRKSPERRRSYSRSPTPPFRRYSPHRGFSNRDRSYSPGRREQQRSKRKSHSPIAKNPVHNRLGSRPYLSQPSSKSNLIENVPKVSPINRSRSSSLSLSPTPERDVKMPLVLQRNRRNDRRNSPERSDARKKDANPTLDPVFEARRKKFETPVEITSNSATVIRLKSTKLEEHLKTEDCEQYAEEGKEEGSDELSKEEQEDENELEEFVELTTKVDDIFSDEESDEENEGRFKSTSMQSRNVTVLPFDKLSNGTNNRVKAAPLSQQNNRRSDRRDRDRNRCRRRSRSPLRSHKSDSKTAASESSLDPTVWNSVMDSYKEKNVIKDDSVSKKNRSAIDPARSVCERKKSSHGAANLSPIENKKIEIKIRNPTKYESLREGNEKADQGELTRKEEKSVRKVEISSKKAEKRQREEMEDEVEPEIIVESEEEDSNTNEGGDLRAQLSRKRAERQSKSIKKVLPTRLLQSALQEVVSKVKKVRTTSKSPKSLSENGARCGARRVQLLHSAPRLLIKFTAAEANFAHEDSRKPIHMRLGVAAKGSDSFEGGSSRKKSKNRKTKNRIAVDQV